MPENRLRQNILIHTYLKNELNDNVIFQHQD